MSVTENEKGRKEQNDSSMQQRRRSDDGKQCGNAWSGLENESKKVGGLPKELHEGGVKKLSRAGMVPTRTWRVHAVEMAPTERFKLRRQMAAAAGKKSTISVSFFFMEVSGLEVDEKVSTLATQTRFSRFRRGDK